MVSGASMVRLRVAVSNGVDGWSEGSLAEVKCGVGESVRLVRAGTRVMMMTVPCTAELCVSGGGLSVWGVVSIS